MDCSVSPAPSSVGRGDDKQTYPAGQAPQSPCTAMGQIRRRQHPTRSTARPPAADKRTHDGSLTTDRVGVNLVRRRWERANFAIDREGTVSGGVSWSSHRRRPGRHEIDAAHLVRLQFLRRTAAALATRRSAPRPLSRKTMRQRWRTFGVDRDRHPGRRLRHSPLIPYPSGLTRNSAMSAEAVMPMRIRCLKKAQAGTGDRAKAASATVRRDGRRRERHGGAPRRGLEVPTLPIAGSWRTKSSDRSWPRVRRAS